MPDLDLDLDHLTKGLVMHALFENLTDEPMRFEYNDEELRNLVEDTIKTSKAHIKDFTLRKILIDYYIQLAKSFLNQEKIWRQKFTETNTVGREVEINAYWDFENQKITNKETSIKFKGYIDRVDKDSQGNYVIIDYKSSDAQAKNYKSWVANDKFQLSVYAEAIEAGCTDLSAGPVQGGFYYISKTLDRSKGFKVKDQAQGLFDDSEYRYSTLSADDKKSLYKSINSKVHKDILKIKEGEFAPVPKKIETCETCYWRNLCRAPHLI
jgi:ATP-dependent helicase/nuclease subunit B